MTGLPDRILNRGVAAFWSCLRKEKIAAITPYRSDAGIAEMLVPACERIDSTRRLRSCRAGTATSAQLTYALGGRSKGRCAWREILIAVIDADESFRMALVECLGPLGYGARGFASGEECIAWEADASCNCVITDIHMPGMSGLRLGRLLTARRAGFPA